MWVETKDGTLVNLERVSVLAYDTAKTDKGAVGRVAALNERREVLAVLWHGTLEACSEIMAGLHRALLEQPGPALLILEELVPA